MAPKTNMHHTYNTCMRAYINTHNYAVIVIKDVSPGRGCTQRCVYNAQTSSPGLPPTHSFWKANYTVTLRSIHTYQVHTRAFANTDADVHAERVTGVKKKKTAGETKWALFSRSTTRRNKRGNDPCGPGAARWRQIALVRAGLREGDWVRVCVCVPAKLIHVHAP